MRKSRSWRDDEIGSLTWAFAIEADGGRACVIEADLTDQQQAVDAVERAVSELGQLDIVVNNAGVMLLGPALDAPTQEWDQMIALTCRA